MKCATALFFFFSVCTASGQLQKKDSVLDLCKRASDPIQKATYLNYIAQNLLGQNSDSVIIYGKKALALSKRNNDVYSRVESLRSVAMGYSYAAKFDEGLDVARKALKMAQNSNIPRAKRRALATMAYMYYNKEEIDSLLKYDLLALEITEKIGPADELLNAYNDLALDYSMKGYYSKSLDYFLKGLRLCEQLKIKDSRLANVYHNLGNLYEQLNQSKNALESHQKALEIIEGPIETRLRLRINCYISLARAYLQQGYLEPARYYADGALNLIGQAEFDTSSLLYHVFTIQGNISEKKNLNRAVLGHYTEAKKNADASGHFILKGRARLNISNFYISLGEIDNATMNLDSVEQFAKKSGDLKQQRDFYRTKARIDSLKGDLISYGESIFKFIQYQDSLASVEKQKALDVLQIEYDTELKDNEIALLQRENEIRSIKQKQMTQLQFGLIVLTLLLLCFILVLYKRYSDKQRSIKLIASKNEENKLLVKETHHRVKNNLQIMLSLLSSKAEYLQEDTPGFKIVEESKRRIRSLALIHEELYQNTTLSSINLRVYLEKLLTLIEKSLSSDTTQVNIKTYIANVEIRMSMAVSLGLIVNELVSNVYKYAFRNRKQGNITVRFVRSKPGYFYLHVEDDGIGLPPDFDLHALNSLGLQLVKGLAEQCNGSVSIDTSEKGSRFSVLLKTEE